MYWMDIHCDTLSSCQRKKSYLKSDAAICQYLLWEILCPTILKAIRYKEVVAVFDAGWVSPGSPTPSEMTRGHFMVINSSQWEGWSVGRWPIRGRKGECDVCSVCPVRLHCWRCYWCFQLLPALHWFHFPSRYKVISTHSQGCFLDQTYLLLDL